MNKFRVGQRVRVISAGKIGEVERIDPRRF